MDGRQSHRKDRAEFHLLNRYPHSTPRSFRLHDTRHTTATLLLAAGVDLYAVARILRHTDPKLTFRIYAHLVPGYLQAQIDRLPPGAPAKFAAQVLQTPPGPVDPPRRQLQGPLNSQAEK